jgi:hypothetical protein
VGAAEFLPYLTTVIGFLIVYVLNGIKGEIGEVKVSVNSLEKDMREGITSLDRRLTIVETRCTSEHHNG